MPRIDVRTGPVTIPVFALAALIEWEGVGEPHLVLRPPRVWREPAEQAELSRAAFDALAGSGVLSGQGQVDQHLRDVLPLLTAPLIDYSGWFTDEGRTKGVLAAAGALDAVVAVRDGDLVRVASASRDRLAAAMIAELPDVPAGKGSRLEVTGADIEHLHAPSGVAERQVPENVAQLIKAVRRPVRDGGELYTASRDAVGRSVTRGPVWFADTDDGRYLNHTSGVGDTLTIVHEPATTAALISALDRVGAPMTRPTR